MQRLLYLACSLLLLVGFAQSLSTSCCCCQTESAKAVAWESISEAPPTLTQPLLQPELHIKSDHNGICHPQTNTHSCPTGNVIPIERDTNGESTSCHTTCDAGRQHPQFPKTPHVSLLNQKKLVTHNNAEPEVPSAISHGVEQASAQQAVNHKCCCCVKTTLGEVKESYRPSRWTNFRTRSDAAVDLPGTCRAVRKSIYRCTGDFGLMAYTIQGVDSESCEEVCDATEERLNAQRSDPGPFTQENMSNHAAQAISRTAARYETERTKKPLSKRIASTVGKTTQKVKKVVGRKKPQNRR